jgi:hypothetical protein
LKIWKSWNNLLKKLPKLATTLLKWVFRNSFKISYPFCLNFSKTSPKWEIIIHWKWKNKVTSDLPIKANSTKVKWTKANWTKVYLIKANRTAPNWMWVKFIQVRIKCLWMKLSKIFSPPKTTTIRPLKLSPLISISCSRTGG